MMSGEKQARADKSHHGSHSSNAVAPGRSTALQRRGGFDRNGKPYAGEEIALEQGEIIASLPSSPSIAENGFSLL